MASKPSQKLGNVHADLRRRITSGEWKVGDKLPKEKELAEHYASSLGTVSKAMALLTHEGLVARRPRAGSHVLSLGGASEGNSRAMTGLESYAIIYPSEQNDGIWRTVRAFQAAAHQAHRRVLMLASGLDYAKEAEFVEHLQDFGVLGAVIYPVLPTAREQRHFEQLVSEVKVPLVLADVGLSGIAAPAVVVDNLHAAHTVTRHLVEAGCRRVGFFSNYARLSSMRDRYMGYRWALQEAGLTEPAGGVLLEADMNPSDQEPFAEPERLARRLFATIGAELDGLVCADDYLAIGAQQAAQKMGLPIGAAGLRIVGIGDIAQAERVTPPLTTYRINYTELGQACFEMLDQRVRGLATPHERFIRGELIVRAS